MLKHACMHGPPLSSVGHRSKRPAYAAGAMVVQQQQPQQQQQQPASPGIMSDPEKTAQLHVVARQQIEKLSQQLAYVQQVLRGGALPPLLRTRE